ncbi:MAG: NAD(P)-binding protein, partial [Bdellovibrionaceae bacterium]|nr:NAD(P)-binding protein [Pseudobdellovibrionaceae bacterium]
MKNLNKKNNFPVEIIGAGFSGLSLAYFFIKQGYPVKIIEKTQRVGGVIHSFSAENGAFLVETAANGFVNSAKIEELFQDIRCEMIFTQQTAKKRYLFKAGKLHRWPLSFYETLSGIGRLLWRVLTGTIKPLPEEDFYSWALRCTNKSFNDYLLQPMINGIFATATEKLSAKLVLKSLFYKKIKPTKGRGLVSAPLGMQEVIDKLKEFLVTHGVEFIFKSEASDIKMLHNSFLATSLSSYI